MVEFPRPISVCSFLSIFFALNRLCCITPCCETFDATENNERTRMYRENRDLINRVNQFIFENQRDARSKHINRIVLESEKFDLRP